MQPVRLLFVEDDLIDQKSFERFVKNEKLDFKYKIATTLNEAIRLLEKFEFDLILTDVNLTDGTAFDLYTFIPNFVPVIFITGAGDEETILKALKLGVADYLVKDINGRHLKTLPSCITKALNKQKELYRHIEKLIEAHKQSLTKDANPESLQANHHVLDALAFRTHVGVVITNAKALILRVNKAFNDITGYPSSEVIGKNMNILQSGKQDKTFYEQFWKQLLETGRYQGSIWNRGKNHTLYLQWVTITALADEAGETTHYVAILSNITAQYEADQRIRQLAFYDPLTSLANRRLLIDRLKQELAISKRRELYGSLIYLDIDKFKALNDTCGHHIGDQLLIQVAQRLNSVLREEDTASRLGGDEFVVLIHATETSLDKAKNDALLISKKIKNELNKPYQLGDGEHYFTPSIGISIFPDNGSFAEEILQYADKAMYSSKDKGGNAISIFQKGNEPHLKEVALHILLIEDSITDTQLTVETLKDFSVNRGITLDIKTLGDGAAGLEYLNNKGNKNTLPDLVLLDLNLPNIDGYQILSQVKSNLKTKSIPIVVFSAITEYTIIDKCLKLQADDFIQKPLTINNFTQTLKNLGFGSLMTGKN